MHNADFINFVAKSDYAANCGDQARNEIDGGPAAGNYTPPVMPTLENGVSYRCSKVNFNAIFDGTSHTIAVGEKYLSLNLWSNGLDAADNENMYTGYNNDVFRSSNDKYYPPRCDATGIVQHTYGSIHRGIFHVVLCDGAVRTINTSIALEPYKYLGSRHDRQVFTLD